MLENYKIIIVYLCYIITALLYGYSEKFQFQILNFMPV